MRAVALGVLLSQITLQMHTSHVTTSQTKADVSYLQDTLATALDRKAVFLHLPSVCLQHCATV